MNQPRAEQLSLLKEQVRRSRPKPGDSPAPELPYARVLVDVPLAHLDRPFDYSVPASMHDDAVAGARVKVRFSGRDVDGFLLERLATTDHPGRIAPLRKVVSAEPVLSPEIFATARAVADRYAGIVSDVLRLAVPPRHARVEKETSPYSVVTPGGGTAVEPGPWERYRGGEAFVRRLGAGESPRAVWTALPGGDWADCLATAAVAALTAGRGSVVCVPDQRDLALLDAALSTRLGAGQHVTLTSDLGPAARYRSFLAASRGHVQIVIGTRAAAFAPVRNLGLVAIWDDGDDLHAEPRAPYPHAREVLLLRALEESTAVVIGAHSRSVEAASLVETGWAASLEADRDELRRSAPVVHIAGDTDHDQLRDQAAAAARVPRRVFETVRQALTQGSVLVHTPRQGYLPSLACAACREPARCSRCTGPLAKRSAAAAPVCAWCGHAEQPWVCPDCSATVLRAPVVGSLRTAEEWGRSFPQTAVIASGGDHVLAELPERHAIVVATPGAEPRVPDGYAAAVILDTWLTLARPSLNAEEEALRRWLNIAAMVRPAVDGGTVVVVGDPQQPALQALVRLDPEGFAARQLGERRSARMAPATRIATITAAPELVTEALTALDLPTQSDVLGPVQVDDKTSRVIVRTPRTRGAALSRQLAALQASRSSRKLPPVRVQVDPVDLA